MGRRPTERETNCGLLNGHRQVLDRLVQLLLTKETIDGSELYDASDPYLDSSADRVRSL